MKRGQLHINILGFSLVEILVAISVFLIFFSAISDTTISSFRQVQHSVNKERATALAEEALEASRNIRDADFANLTSGTYGIVKSSNQFNFLGSSDTTGIFNRSVTISAINGEQKKADVTVSWVDQVSSMNSVTLSTYLTNWRAIVNIGLTISKNVINHGGSLLVTDFLPVNLNTTSFDNSVDPPVLQNITIPITFSPSTMNLVAGTYTFSTTNNPNYELTLSPDCGGGSVILNNGDAKFCSINYEEYVIPTVITPTSASINQTSAILGANVTYLGVPSVISSRGTCWATTPEPTINCLAEGSTTIGTFTHARTGFTANTQYYYRGYAINSTGTAYSPDGTFTTASNFTTPTVTTTAVSLITQATASSGGNVTSDGGASVTDRGVVWSTSTGPTIALSTKTSNGTGTGSFSSSITGLTCNTLYYVRAYATNSVGTNYGNELTFRTASCITYVASATSGATTITIPVHQVGDLMIMLAHRENNTPATVPLGWTSIVSSGGGNLSSVLAYRIATATNDSSGTWTNAQILAVHIYRGQSTSTPIGANALSNGNGTVVTYPGLTLTQNNGSSWVIGFAGHRRTNTTLESPPTGMVNRTNFVSAASEAAGHDTSAGVTTWNSTNVSVGGTADSWRARTLEIISK